MSQIKTLSKTYFDEEIKQAYTRIIFLMMAVSSLVYFTYHLNSDINILKYILTLFAVGSFFHLFFIRQWPEKYLTLRKITIIFFDIFGVTAFMYYLESYGILYSPLFLWIIMGNGIRFGENYLYIAMGVALSGLVIILLFSSYWYDNLYTLIALAIAVVLLPLFYAKLLKRLNYKNEKLEQLLQLTEYQSKHDNLTDLPNRRYFELELNEAIEQNKKFALFIIDLDGFKNINDTLGHAMGDYVLQEAALRLQKAIPSDNMVARLGGDEFVVIVRNDFLNIKELAHQTIQALSKPYGEKGEVTSISASIGISYYPDDTKDESLLKKYADIAMYKVKLNGKNSFIEYCDIT